MDRNFLSILLTAKGSIALSVGIGLVLVGGQLAQALLVAAIIYSVAVQHALVAGMHFAFLLGVVIAARAVLAWWSEVATQRATQKIKEALRNRLVAKLLDLGPVYTAAQGTAGLKAIVIDAVDGLDPFVGRFLPQIAVTLLGTALAVAVVAMIAPWAAVLLAAFIVLVPITNAMWLAWRMPGSASAFATIGAFGALLLDSLQGIVTLKTFDAAEMRRGELVRRARQLRDVMMKAISVIVVRDAYTTVLVLGGTVIVVVCSSLRIASWRMSQFQLLALLLLTREAFRPMERLLNEFHEAHAGGAAAGSIMKVLGEPPLIRENAATCKVTCGSRVEFRDVSFSYSAGAQVLNSVAFRVEDGETVALVGPSGAGKSTVVALLLRFFDPNTGSIFIGDVNIRDLALNALRRRVGVVSQDIHLFYGSILDNIRMGAREANLDTVIAAATAANAHEFIQGLPMGYDTIVGERGAQLSGGQRQRLAIARAILKDAPILVLDEATSSLDAESERAVQEAMGRLTIGRTVLVVAHRLSTIRGADRILILDRGSIVEAGTHAELMAKRGRYAKLAFTQEGAA